VVIGEAACMQEAMRVAQQHAEEMQGQRVYIAEVQSELERSIMELAAERKINDQMRGIMQSLRDGDDAVADADPFDDI
jgi:hypothetical protein